MTSFALMHPEKFTFMMLSFALCDLCFLSHLVTNIDGKFRFACVAFHTIMVKVFFFSISLATTSIHVLLFMTEMLAC